MRRFDGLIRAAGERQDTKNVQWGSKDLLGAYP